SPMAMPTTFAGEAVECSGFLLQVNLFIKMQPQLFTSDDAKVAFLISLLTGKALLWAKAIWNADNPIIHSFIPTNSLLIISPKFSVQLQENSLHRINSSGYSRALLRLPRWLLVIQYQNPCKSTPHVCALEPVRYCPKRSAKRLNPRQARWALFFTRFDYKITYRPGSKNISADALSRLHSTEQPVEPEPIVPSNLISPIIWELDEDIRSATLQEAAPPECPEGKIFVPLALRQNLLDTAHRSPGSGHPGSQRTLSLLQSRYWWPSMCRDTIRYVQSCSVCAMSTSPRQLPTGKLVPLPIPQRPWSHIGVDFVTDLPAAEGNACILGLPTAMETAETLFQHLFGLPEEIVSDRGPQFISHVWKAFFKLLGVTVNLSSGYHPQTNGQTERKIQELGQLPPGILRFLPWAEYAQNSLRQDTTGLTLFQCVLGYQPPLFPWTEEPSNVPAVDHCSSHLQRAVRQHKRFADVRRRPAPEFQPGDQVWLSTRDLRLRQPCRKLSPRYIGPFKILRRINDVTFQLQLPPRYRIHPTFHVSLLKPCYPSATEQPGAEILEPPSIYTVHEILGSRRRGGRLEYLIDWEGYGPEERSWVSRDDILDPTLLTDFHRDHPAQPAPRGRGRRELPLEEGVVSGIHHCHLHLTHTR
ncbi:hypothetical protein M9458_056384, partial [Cirrhinus mrigala]